MRRRSTLLAVLATLSLAIPSAGWADWAISGDAWNAVNQSAPPFVTWGYMDPGILLDPGHPLASEVSGGNDIASMRATYDASYGAGAFDAAIQRAFDTWESLVDIQFLGPVADGGGAVGAPGATSPDIRIGAFNAVPLTPFADLGAVGYGPPGPFALDPVAGDILFNLGQLAIEPSGAEDDPIVGPGNDLENLTLHEIGHAAMGMFHPIAGPGEVMYVVQPDCCNFINRIPSDDDLRGARTVYGPPLLCEDGLDNDGDGLVDLADPGCDDALDPDETSDALVCDNGIDDDLDGLTDWAGGAGDPGCQSATSVRENPQCQDGINNDGALGTDFDGGESVLGVGNGDPDGADPQCTTAWRNREAANTTSCGLGPVLTGALLPLWLVARRRAKR